MPYSSLLWLALGALLNLFASGRWSIPSAAWLAPALLGFAGNEGASLDPVVAPNQTMVAHVPVGHVPTVYARFGDWFGYLCVAGLLPLCIWRLAFTGRLQ